MCNVLTENTEISNRWICYTKLFVLLCIQINFSYASVTIFIVIMIVAIVITIPTISHKNDNDDNMLLVAMCVPSPEIFCFRSHNNMSMYVYHISFFILLTWRLLSQRNNIKNLYMYVRFMNYSDDYDGIVSGLV